MKKQLHLIVLVLILFIGLLLRIVSLSNIPSGLNQDEAVNGYDSYSLLITLHDHRGNFMPTMLESFGDYTSPLLTYLTIPFVYIFGLNAFSIRLPVALLGVGTIFLTYVILIQLKKTKEIALTGAFLMSVIPWQISLSRWAIAPNIVPFFTLLLISTLLWAKSGTKWYKFVLCGISSGVLMYSYPTLKVFAPLFILGIIFICFKIRKDYKSVISFVIPATILSAPMMTLTIFHANIYNNRFKEVSIFALHGFIPFEFISRYVSYFTPYFNFGYGDPNIMQHIPVMGLSYGFLEVFFYLGLIICIYLAIKSTSISICQNSRILLLWLILFPIPASLTIDSYQTLRVIHGLPLIIFLSVIGLEEILKHMKGNILLYIFNITIFISAISFTHYYFMVYPPTARIKYQYGIQEVYSFLLTHESEFDYVNIDQMFNNSYIYYLFYSKYNPQDLNYSQINAVQEGQVWDGAHNIGKYHFHYINEDLSKYKLIYQVSDQTRVYEKIYSLRRTWVVERIL